MPDVFISYSSQDEKLAQFVYKHLIAERLTVFLASVSLRPGDRWRSEIMSNLRASEWIILLASRTACESKFVQQELGGAEYAGKKIIPIVWGMPPSDLPGWPAQHQAVNLSGATLESISETVSEIARRIKARKTVGQLIIGAVLLWLLVNR